MFIIRIPFALVLLLFLTTASFAQSENSIINIPHGGVIKLQANVTNASTYQWLKDGLIIPSATAKVYEVRTAGKYTVIAFNSEGCGSPPSTVVEITMGNPEEVLHADLAIVKTSERRSIHTNDIFEYQIHVKNNGPNSANDVTIKDVLPANLSYETVINPTHGTANYNLQTNTITWIIPKMDINEEIYLKLKVKATTYGVYKNTATVTATEKDPNLANNTSTDLKSVYGISIPNVFTPNGDGKNDTFNILGLLSYELNELSIVNRWGSSVYEKKNYQNDWTANGLNDGTYFYVLKIRDENNTWQIFNGYITVIR